VQLLQVGATSECVHYHGQKRGHIALEKHSPSAVDQCNGMTG
jgi:hypothetical protein